jgi:DNA-directed RNA polymerase specialized sigma24 family protein
MEDKHYPPLTHWSLVARTQDAHTEVRRAALDLLIRNYLPALRSHLVYHMRLNDSTADDVVQGFIVQKVLERNLLAGAHPNKGRFRSLILRSLENHAIDVLRHQRRIAGRESQSSDNGDECAQPGVSRAPADIFDAMWARQVLSQALRIMRSECHAQGCEQRWRLFERRVLRPIFDHEEPPAYEALLEEFQFASPQQACNALVTAKRHFQRALSQVVGKYAAGNDEIDSELADLQTIVRTAGPLGMNLHLVDDERVVPDESPSGDEGSRDTEILAKLLAVETDVESPWQTADYPGLWRHLLSQPLDSLLAGAGPSRAMKFANPDALSSLGTVADLLRQSEPPIELLRALKERARKLARAKQNEYPNEIGTALYFASIAVAKVKRQTRISKTEDAALEHGIRLLLSCSWLDDETCQTLRSALRR